MSAAFVMVTTDRLSKSEETFVTAHIESLSYDSQGSVGYMCMSSGRRVRLYKEDYERIRRLLAA